MSIQIQNTTWDELAIGAEASVRRTCQQSDLLLFAHTSGNFNPSNMPDAASSAHVVAPSMWLAALVSSALGNELPGPGTLYKRQDLHFGKRVEVGDELTVTIRCTHKGPSPLADFSVGITNQHDEVVCEGLAQVEAPTTSITYAHQELPALFVGQKDHFSGLLEKAKKLPRLSTAVVAPEDANSLSGANLAYQEGLITPVLIGHAERIQQAAQQLGIDIRSWELVHRADHESAAKYAADIAHQGKVGAIMKGALHSDQLLHAVVDPHAGLRTNRRLSHIFLMNVPTLDHLLFISDAAINIAPNLMTKVDIVQNAIDVAHACGIDNPRVGILSAVETVNANIPSTIDAAILCKMADRGQITGATVDGPLAMDNAINLEAAKTKGIDSLVAGRADVLIVPNLEAGNMLAKELTFLAQAEAAGLAVGATVPIILTSRADDDRSRLASSALAQIYWNWQSEQKRGDLAAAIAQEAAIV